mgnify:CR=1 FL=1
MPTYELGRSTCEREGVDSRGILAFTCRHVENSVTKTFTSVAVGILYDRGLLSLDELVYPYFSNPSYADNGLETLTIRHLLTMTLGQDGPDMFAAGDESRDWCESI